MLVPGLLLALTQVQQFAGVDAAVQEGIDSGVYPAAVVVIGRRDTLLYTRGYGTLTWNPEAAPPDPDSTLWDIASLTKVVATASSAMRLADAGKLDLDSRGWTADRAWGDPAWNPQWFVAAGPSGEAWSAEAAISLEQLGAKSVDAGQAWACRIERRAPGAAAESWPPGKQARGPQRLGLLLFE